ncbi:unnamed protein product [Dicrocoelium dendriticum]|nr:unnamed protein product [Dicrocoelium dendriticum]
MKMPSTAQKERTPRLREATCNQSKAVPKRSFANMKRHLMPTRDVAVLDGSDGQALVSSTSCAFAFAAHFASAFADNQASVLRWTQIVLMELYSLDCKVNDVFKLLANLDGTKPVGSDVLHPMILKSLSAMISPSVTELFNRSLSVN